MTKPATTPFVALQKFPLTKRIEILDKVQEPDRILTYLKAELKGEFTLYVRELLTPRDKLYSYHLQDKNAKLILRYDNAHYYKEIITSPHHKHLASTKEI